eukprot:scaffold1655_cov247-Pinguiococcus_pyrenoidosus.AAC.19
MSNIHGFGSAREQGERPERDPEGQNYYAGGGGGQGGSGLNVIGPGEGNDADNSVERIIQRAQADTAQGAGGDAVPATVVRITMYRNGFTVDDGPFRAIDDPANRPFLADLGGAHGPVSGMTRQERGFIPRELTPEGPRRDNAVPRVDVELSDKRGEDYVPPPAPAYTAFAGAGNAIGGDAIEEKAIVAADEVRARPFAGGGRSAWRWYRLKGVGTAPNEPGDLGGIGPHG